MARVKSELEVVPAGWLSMQEASEQLGRSERSIERLVGAGKLDSKMQPRAGRVPERVVNAEGVRKLKQEFEQRANRTALQPAQPDRAARGEAVKELVNRLSALPPVPAMRSLWLSLEEAADYSNLAESFLLGAIVSGKLAAVKGGPHGSWRIRRVSLEEFAG